MLNDQSPMPFGTHKGEPMGDLTSEYLDWLSGQRWIKDWPEVEDYIRRSRKAIDQDLRRKGKI